MLSFWGFRKSRWKAGLAGGAALIAATATGAMAQDAYVSMKDPGYGTAWGGFFERLYKAYYDEWGIVPAADPNAVTRRPAPWPPSPEPAPPFPFTEWPMGGANYIGVTTPNSIDSPLMTALKPTDFGHWLNDNHIQIYGWLNPGGNISDSKGGTYGNYPAAYAYKPNTIWNDQAVLIIERLPDTVQKDHIDWGFRLSGIYGETYRYTTAQGLASYQLQKRNNEEGYDFPMVYGELYYPWLAEGFLLRVGRYISVPDIEAQLAPNNYMYSHSMTYAYDNYTNTGVIGTLQLNRNWTVQTGVTIGTDSIPFNDQMKDPGLQPSLTACARWQSDTAYNTVYSCANAINNGTYGYNNLQQYTTTFYHKFNDQWHLSLEGWFMHENNTPATTDSTTGLGNPVSPANGSINSIYTSTYPNQSFINNLLGFANGPWGAKCKYGQVDCTSKEFSLLAYLNYQFSPLDNLSLRGESFHDINGQRTGVATVYNNWAIGWQHWFSPTVTFRPEVAFYNSGEPAFGRNNANFTPTQSHLAIFSADLIWHF
jgi:hypothetical protein